MKNVIIFLLLTLTLRSLAETKLPHLFSDGMVLQRSTEVSIWGTDKAGTEIKISSSWNKTATAKTDQQGKWIVKLPTPVAGGPYTIDINGSSHIQLKDVLIGEVWICTGQSNMEMQMKGRINQPVEGSNEAILNSENNSLRFLMVEKGFSNAPVDDIKGDWMKASPATTAECSAVAYYYGKKLQEYLKVPVGLIISAYGGSTIEEWLSQEALSKVYRSIPAEKNDDNYSHRKPSELYNRMLNPIIGYTMRGCIWYQGEQNVWNPASYPAKMSSLIESWRKGWDEGAFPFYYVQIAPYDSKAYNAGALRDAQFRVLKEVKNTGMAVTLDLGECRNIHPPKKKEVGDRLAYWALTNNYDVKGPECSGPIFKSIYKIDSNRVSMNFDHSANGIYCTSKSVTGFEVAGADKVFYPAQVTVQKNMGVVVWSEKVSKPVAVRYAFDNCAQATLFNTAGLPAPTFRTDNW